MKKYIIINRTALEKRIEELEKKSKELYYREGIDEYNFAKEELEELLSQSTPLIPEIEKAFTKGERYGWDTQKSIGNIEQIKEKIKSQSLKDYISNLKLDI